MNQSTKPKLMKQIKSDNFFCRKVGRAITKWGIIDISPISILQYGKIII